MAEEQTQAAGAEETLEESSLLEQMLTDANIKPD